MNSKIIDALNSLEQKYKDSQGYDVRQILGECNILCNRTNEKNLRARLRFMISKSMYPEFKSGGDEDIVYCPSGKNSGRYRLSKYRNREML